MTFWHVSCCLSDLNDDQLCKHWSFSCWQMTEQASLGLTGMSCVMSHPLCRISCIHHDMCNLDAHFITITRVKVLNISCWCLQEIPELAGVPAFWVNSAACVDVARNKITHKLAHGELIETEPWLKDGPITIGEAPATI